MRAGEAESIQSDVGAAKDQARRSSASGSIKAMIARQGENRNKAKANSGREQTSKIIRRTSTKTC